MVTVMLIGQADCCEKARALIEEAMDNKEEKQKQRQKEYAKKRDAKVGLCCLSDVLTCIAGVDGIKQSKHAIAAVIGQCTACQILAAVWVQS